MLFMLLQFINFASSDFAAVYWSLTGIDWFIDSSLLSAGFGRAWAARSVSRIALWKPGLRRNMYPARRWRTRAADSQPHRSMMSRRALTLKWGAGWILMFSFMNNTWAQGKSLRFYSGPWDSALTRQCDVWDLWKEPKRNANGISVTIWNQL